MDRGEFTLLGALRAAGAGPVAVTGLIRGPMRVLGTLALLSAATALVAACGGGGGGAGDGAGPQATAPPSPVALRAQEHRSESAFRNQWGLSAIRADRAWARLEVDLDDTRAPGTGQTVGLIDSGIDTGHPVFAGKTVTEVIVSGDGDAAGDSPSHGTGVAAVIVGRPSDSHTAETRAGRGVAWGADVAMFAIATGSGGGNYVPASLTGLASSDSGWASLLDTVIGWSSGAIDFVNVSVGSSGIVEQYSEADLRANYGDTIAALAQTGASEKTVFVFAAGNAHGKSCDPADFVGHSDLCVSFVDGRGMTHYLVNARSVEFDSGLPARISELRGHVIAVVAIRSDGTIASFSNRCGIAAQWCIAAPGQFIRTAYYGPHPIDNTPGARGAHSPSGTSFSAPMVTGALVVMKHYYRDQLANTALVSRLLETANDRGIYASSSIYGHGLLDLDAALTPRGTQQVALGNRVDGPGVDLTRTGLTLGDALGDGLKQALAGQEIVAFDELGAPFWYALGAFARSADDPLPVARLQGFMAQPEAERGSGIWRPAFGAVAGDDAAVPLRLGLLATSRPGSASGHLALAGRALALRAAGQGGLSAAAFSTEGLDGQAPVSGAALSWRPADAPLGLRGGYLRERAGLLGSRTAGAFGRMAAGSAFAGVEASAQAGPWRLGGGAEVGTVRTSVRDGLIADLSPLTTSAFALRAERALGDAGAALSFSLSQPLRVEAGRARLSVPVGRTKDGRVLRRSMAAALAPSGRQIEFAAAWRRPLARDTALRLGAVWTRHPGHAAGADPDLTLLAGLRHSF